MRRNGPLAIALGILVTACAAEAPLPGLSSVEIDAPPGPDSEEPFLSSFEGGVHFSWLERADGGHQLRMASLTGRGWGEPLTIASGEQLLASWADFPSVTADADGSLWAHWLERGHHGGYGVRVARSGDSGSTWSEPWILHQDTSEAEHGFVTTVTVEGRRAFVWLDGRSFAGAGASERTETALYLRSVDGAGPAGPELLLDSRVCDCCQTDAATTEDGPILVYRDRSPQEIRDIAVVRWSGGAWTEPRPVFVDGWETGACPVNGPAVDAAGSLVAVAWFTAAEGVPRVKVAFSEDSGRRFGEPVTVDDGDPAGRVDVVLLADGSALVGWLERTEADRTDVRARYVTSRGRAGPSLRVSAPAAERVSGFARMARAFGEGGERVVVAWTDASGMQPHVRVTAVDVEDVRARP